MTNELLTINPFHERASGNKVYYEKELSKSLENEIVAKGDDDRFDIPTADYDAMASIITMVQLKRALLFMAVVVKNYLTVYFYNFTVDAQNWPKFI